MKIALFDMAHWDQKHLQSMLPHHELKFYDYSIHEENIEQVKEADALIIFTTSHVDKETLSQFPNLKLICVMANSADNVDLAACKKRNVTVCVVPYHGENSMAEHSFALILALSRNLVPSVLRTRGNNFNPEGLEGFDLAGKTLGVIGTGHSGMHTIKIAKGFGMQVLAYDKEPQELTANKHGFEYTNLKTLLRDADVVSLHIPYNKKNHHFFDAEKIGNMNPKALLIDVSQGPVVDDDALVRALQEKHIAGAGLDFVEGQNILDTAKSNNVWEINEELLLMKNVLITPSTSFNTRDALSNIEKYTCYNVKKFEEEEPVNLA